MQAFAVPPWWTSAAASCRSPSPRRPRRPLVCTAAHPTLQAIEYASSDKLQLLPASDGNNDDDGPLYVRCEKCTRCYRVPSAAAIEGRQLRCSHCSATWVAQSSQVLTRVRDPKRAAAAADAADAGAGADIPCPHFRQCSGCTLDTKVARPPALVELEAFVASAPRLRTPIPVVAGSPTQWRTTAKLAVRREARRGGGRRRGYTASRHSAPKTAPAVVGLYREHSHDVVAIPECLVHHPSINEATQVLTEELARFKVSAYDESTGQGDLRYIQAVVERPTGLVQLVLVWNAMTVKETAPLSTRLTRALWDRRHEARLHSVWLNLNSSNGNVILRLESHRWTLLKGPDAVKDNVCGIDVEFPPYSFRQANLDAFEALVHAAAKQVPPRSTLVEFCGGLGLIGLALLRLCDLKHVHVTEANALAEEGFERTRKLLPGHLRERTTFEIGTMASLASRTRGVDVILADPPRGGLDQAFVSALCRLGREGAREDEAAAYRASRKKRPRSAGKPSAREDRQSSNVTFIYMSCGLDSFKRDTRTLLQAGWRLTSVQAAVFFPGANHVETLGIFQLRRAGTKHS